MFFPHVTIFYLKLLKIKIKIQCHTYENQQLKSSEPGLWDCSSLGECEVRGYGHEELLGHRHIFCIPSSAEQSHYPVIWLPVSFQPSAQSIHGTSHLQAYDVTLTWGRGVQASPLWKTGITWVEMYFGIKIATFCFINDKKCLEIYHMWKVELKYPHSAATTGMCSSRLLCLSFVRMYIVLNL